MRAHTKLFGTAMTSFLTCCGAFGQPNIIPNWPIDLTSGIAVDDEEKVSKVVRRVDFVPKQFRRPMRILGQTNPRNG